MILLKDVPVELAPGRPTLEEFDQSAESIGLAPRYTVSRVKKSLYARVSFTVTDHSLLPNRRVSVRAVYPFQSLPSDMSLSIDGTIASFTFSFTPEVGDYLERHGLGTINLTVLTVR